MRIQHRGLLGVRARGAGRQTGRCSRRGHHWLRLWCLRRRAAPRSNTDLRRPKPSKLVEVFPIRLPSERRVSDLSDLARGRCPAQRGVRSVAPPPVRAPPPEGRRLLKDGSTPPQRSPSPRVTLTDDEAPRARAERGVALAPCGAAPERGGVVARRPPFVCGATPASAAILAQGAFAGRPRA